MTRMSGETGEADGRSRRGAVSRRGALAGSVGLAGLTGGGALLAACGVVGGEPAGGGAPSRAAGGSAVFMAWGDAERTRIRDGLVPRIQDTSGVKAEWIHATGGVEYYDKLQSMVASDTAPDLFLFAPSYFLEFVQAGRLAALTPLIKRDRYDLADFPTPSIEQYTWQGVQQGFPQDFPTRGLVYNVDLFERAGVPLPPRDYGFAPSAWSWQTFLEAARKTTAGDPEAGGTFGFNTNFGWRPYSVWAFTNGGEFFNKDLTECTITEPRTVEAMQWVADLIGRYRVAPTRAITQRERYNPLFAGGRVAMMESLPADLGVFRAASGLRFDVAPVPVSPTGKKAATGGGSGQGMAASSKNKDAAWEFLKFMLGPEAQLEHARGGQTFPSRKSIQLHPQVAVPDQMPRSFKLFVDGQQHVRLDPQLTNWRDVEAAINKELTPLWDGQRSAREAATLVKGVVDPLLKEAQARKARD